MAITKFRFLLGLAAAAVAGVAVAATLGLSSPEHVTPQPGEEDGQAATTWIRQFGTSHTDGAEGVGLDREGNLYVVGYTWGDPEEAGQFAGYDASVNKFHPDGDEIWTRRFGTPSSDYAWSAAVSENGFLYVMGQTRGALPGHSNLGHEDVFLRRYDGDGNEVWTLQFGTKFRDEPKDVTVDNHGSVYVAGIARIALEGQTKIGNEDAYLRKYDPDGNEVWTRQFGTKGTDHVTSITADGNGHIYVVGPTSGTFPGQTWAGEYDAYLSKFDDNGNALWTRQFGAEETDTAVDVTTDSEGRVYTVGFFRIALPGQRVGVVQNALVHSFDGEGNQLWSREFGTVDEDFATNVAVDQAGDIYVVGRTDGAFAGQVNFGGNDAFVRKYSNDGEELWTYQFGSRSGDNIKDIILDDAGSLYAVGRTNGVLAGQESKGLADAFLIKLSTGFSPPPAPAETSGATGFCSSIGLNVSGRLSLGWMLLGLMLPALTLVRLKR